MYEVAVGTTVIVIKYLNAIIVMASSMIAKTTMTSTTTERTAMAIKEYIAFIILLVEEMAASTV